MDRRMKSNRYAYQQQQQHNLISNSALLCPKPRRLPLSKSPSNYHNESCDSRGGMELLDMILTKESYGAERPNYQVPASPPFFMGSPPSRVSNPVIQDAQFGIYKSNPSSNAPEVFASSPCNNGGCARVQFGQKPAAVRIEGFNCHRNCSVSAVA